MGFELKDLASWALAGMPKQVFESKGFKKGTSWFGKAIPNEFSKNQYFQNVPILNWITSGIGATDAAATAYDDTDSVSKAWEAGTAGTFGKQRDPGQYSATGDRADWSSQDAFQGMVGNQVGGIGNFAGRTGIFGGSGKGQATGSAVGTITDTADYYIQPKKARAENGGTEQGNWITNLFSGNSNNSGTTSTGNNGFDLSSILSLFGGNKQQQAQQPETTVSGNRTSDNVYIPQSSFKRNVNTNNYGDYGSYISDLLRNITAFNKERDEWEA